MSVSYKRRKIMQYNFMINKIKSKYSKYEQHQLCPATGNQKKVELHG